MVLSCERDCGRARTIFRRVVEARTKKRGRLSLSDSVWRHSRRRWSRACWAGVRFSMGSAIRGRTKVSGDDVRSLAKSGSPFGKLRAGCFTASGEDVTFGRDDGAFFTVVETELFLIDCETESFGVAILFRIALRQMAMISAPYRSILSGPMPEMVRSSLRLFGAARMRF